MVREVVSWAFVVGRDSSDADLRAEICIGCETSSQRFGKSSRIWQISSRAFCQAEKECLVSLSTQ